MSSTVTLMANYHQEDVTVSSKKIKQVPFLRIVSSLKEIKCTQDMRKVIHSVKVGISLVLVSLLYLLDPLFKQVGENGMWAIMTVVVVFEFYAGATLSKGINRGIGTVLGGGLGCLAAILADEAGEVGNLVVIVTSVFIFGAAATYCRLVPSIKKRHEYGAMIFILTFNLVAVSGVRVDKVMRLATQRLSTIGIGFAVCIFTSLLICPMWASDALHHSIASNFDKLARSIEGCIEEHFEIKSEKENQLIVDLDGCKSVLHSKSNDESLANFARWEPWRGKFGISYPWAKYLEIGEVLREIAAIILSLKACIKNSKKPSQMLIRQTIREPCETIGLSMAWILKELGESIMQMKKCDCDKVLTAPTSESMKQELSQVEFLSKIIINGDDQEGNENLAITSFCFLLTEMVEKVETLARKVEELGEIAGFEEKNLGCLKYCVVLGIHKE